MKNNGHVLLDHISRSVECLNTKVTSDIMYILCKTNNIFITGSSRSFLAAKAFAIRLTQLGMSVHIAGSTTTPSMRKNDLLLVVSGSSETKSVLTIVNIAKDIDANILLFTSHHDSNLGKLVTVMGHIHIDDELSNAKAYDCYLNTVLMDDSNPTPLGTIFEITPTIFFDALAAKLLCI
jgi:6-phospho-3-hexuloisomerase